MKEKLFTSLVIILSVILVLKSAEAHQPVLNSEKNNSVEEPYIIEEPEVSKAIFAELKGEPHYYRIDSNTKFKFYAGITTPKIDNCPLTKKFSFDVLDSDFELIKKKMGKTLTGGHGMKNMEKNGTGSDRRLERSLNQTGNIIKAPTTFVFITKLTLVNTF